MSTLHVLSHSPFADSRLSSCLRLLGSQDAVLLCGDATYALTASTAARQTLDTQADHLKLFVLAEDLKARNLTLPHWVGSVDYTGFVELSVHYDKVNTWL
ncbi:sulfurtransferase complex subunit TusB [Pseudomonas sp. LP_7_YM]|uniref:sulfurtransferase complex subunit TusB n=1 Tax=Pseudomonas sp. LP_7_YM TaxID=2485137 RepID=UPI001061494F|nr:sulfurtransferase complex subunit TusB [Pseudomonas sp. LP_7_YM]TDV61298.1 tRNA 2-thiouridine synthesizing protein B [Pseudomonas sp. LP_7_YM]